MIMVKGDAVEKEDAGEDIGDGDDGDDEDGGKEESMRKLTVGEPLGSCLLAIEELTEVRRVYIIFLALD